LFGKGIVIGSALFRIFPISRINGFRSSTIDFAALSQTATQSLICARIVTLLS
jgi:hypothetical protein